MPSIVNLSSSGGSTSGDEHLPGIRRPLEARTPQACSAFSGTPDIARVQKGTRDLLAARGWAKWKGSHRPGRDRRWHLRHSKHGGLLASPPVTKDPYSDYSEAQPRPQLSMNSPFLRPLLPDPQSASGVGGGCSWARVGAQEGGATVMCCCHVQQVSLAGHAWQDRSGVTTVRMPALRLLMPLTIPSGPGLQASSSTFKRFLPWPFSAFCLPCPWRAAYPRVLGLLRICHLRR